jgi:hypothetical protein
MDVFHEVPPTQTHYIQPADVRAFVVSPQNFSAFIVKAMNKKSNTTTPLKSYQTLLLDRILRQLNSVLIFTKYFVMYFVIIFRLNWLSLQNSHPPSKLCISNIYFPPPIYLNIQFSVALCQQIYFSCGTNLRQQSAKRLLVGMRI